MKRIVMIFNEKKEKEIIRIKNSSSLCRDFIETSSESSAFHRELKNNRVFIKKILVQK